MSKLCSINVLFDFFSTCHWSNKTLIEHNLDTDLVRLMFCSTLLCTEKGSKNDLKQPILQLSNKIKTIVELNIVEHPDVPQTVFLKKRDCKLIQLLF